MEEKFATQRVNQNPRKECRPRKREENESSGSSSDDNEVGQLLCLMTGMMVSIGSEL